MRAQGRGAPRPVWAGTQRPAHRDGQCRHFVTFVVYHCRIEQPACAKMWVVQCFLHRSDNSSAAIRGAKQRRPVIGGLARDQPSHPCNRGGGVFLILPQVRFQPDDVRERLPEFLFQSCDRYELPVGGGIDVGIAAIRR